MKASLKIIILLLFANPVFSQKDLPIIQATSKKVNIKVGEKLYKKWTIVPKYNPDIYSVGEIGKVVTFYTDIDSISIKIDTKTKFDFIILLNKKDSAYTQIKYKESYLSKLKKAKEYDKNQIRKLPKFTYLDSSDVYLKQIKGKL